MPIAYEPARCPVCAGADSREIADADALRREADERRTFPLRRLTPSAPPAALADRVAFSEPPPLRIVACRRCDTLYRNPRERERSVLDTFAGEQPDPEALRSLFDAQLPFFQRRARELTRLAGRAGRALEVGSYTGAFLAAAALQGWNVLGIDVNPHAVDAARRRGLHARTARIEDIREHHAFDAIAFWTCFDHLPDPRPTLRVARDLLTPGGILALRVPNGRFYERLRRLRGIARPIARGLLAHTNMLAFPYRHGFNPRSLRLLLRDQGFTILRLRGDTLLPATAWTRPWAALERRLTHALTRTLTPFLPPWLDLYATPLPSPARLH